MNRIEANLPFRIFLSLILFLLIYHFKIWYHRRAVVAAAAATT
jgi:hypothetical protein